MDDLNFAKTELIKYWKDDFNFSEEVISAFDKIILTAAARELPDVLIDNLNENGIIVAPVGDPFAQKMIRLRKEKGKIIKETHGDFMFVPIRGEFGQ